MTVFFLLVGLEIKRELVEGELNTIDKALLPAVAALGGIVVPALIYYFINHNDPIAMRGWAIPIATDIAFSLGILSLLGSRISPTVKVFLMALAIFDDLVAVIIIAVFYTDHISILFLLLSFLLCLFLLILNRLHVKALTPYVIVSFIIWACVLKSGVHATLTGIVLAAAIPLRVTKKNKIKPISPAKDLERRLHPWVAFVVVPIFAFANSGVSFIGLHPSHFVTPITLGIALGLFFGKQIGIWCFSMITVWLKWTRKPRHITPKVLYGLSLLAGMGFTMSLFVGSLAFSGSELSHLSPMVRVGVLLGSFVSAVLGYIVLRSAFKPEDTMEC